MQFLIEVLVAFAPVAVFLTVLLHFDSYKLVSLYEVAITLAAGACLCVVSYWLNALLMTSVTIDFFTYSKFVAPVAEESIKAIAVIWLLLRNRIGFMIDAAIMGFAVGTGFAVVENLYYLYAFPQANVGVWIVRGFGTAIMHGGATALLGILSQSMIDRSQRITPLAFVPGLAAAFILHLVYNQFLDAPLIGAIAMLILLPLAMYFVFRKSEHTVHSWLLHDYESHQHLLDQIMSGAYLNTNAGRFINTMARRFSPAHSGLMFDYIRVHTELALRADKLDLARGTGEPLPVEQSDRDKFQRLHELERAIGSTAMMALWPHLHFTRKQLWELNEFEREVREA